MDDKTVAAVLKAAAQAFFYLFMAIATVAAIATVVALNAMKPVTRGVRVSGPSFDRWH